MTKNIFNILILFILKEKKINLISFHLKKKTYKSIGTFLIIAMQHFYIIVRLINFYIKIYYVFFKIVLCCVNK